MGCLTPHKTPTAQAAWFPTRSLMRPSIQSAQTRLTYMNRMLRPHITRSQRVDAQQYTSLAATCPTHCHRNSISTTLQPLYTQCLVLPVPRATLQQEPLLRSCISVSLSPPPAATAAVRCYCTQWHHHCLGSLHQPQPTHMLTRPTQQRDNAATLRASGYGCSCWPLLCALGNRSKTLCSCCGCFCAGAKVKWTAPPGRLWTA